MTVMIEPKDQKRLKDSGKTTIYYVGVDYHAAHKGSPPPVRVKTMVIPMPKLGESIILETVYANDVIFKTTHMGKAAFVAYEAGGAQMAEYINAELSKGAHYSDLSGEKLAKIKAKKVVVEMSDDDLIEAVRLRQDNLPEELLQMLKKDKTAKADAAKLEVKLTEPEAEDEFKNRLRSKPKE